MSDYAKLFNTEEHGQIVVFKQEQEDESGGEIRIFYKPKNMGLCSTGLGFEDSDEGYQSLDKAFDEFSEDDANMFVEHSKQHLPI